jgi:PTH1 family peptidyl-tRNA hydrolase
MSASLIVGLGNPGSQYQHTRHNLGFRVVEALRHVMTTRSDWHNERDVAVAQTTEQPRTFLLKPQTLMNSSGQPVARFVKFYQIPLDRLWVVHDEVDLLFGELRLAFDRGSAGHQGVESIIRTLGSQAFHRLRVGVGSNREAGMPAEDYVLQHFSETEEHALMSTVLPAAVSRLLLALEQPSTN